MLVLASKMNNKHDWCYNLTIDINDDSHLRKFYDFDLTLKGQMICRNRNYLPLYISIGWVFSFVLAAD